MKLDEYTQKNDALTAEIKAASESLFIEKERFERVSSLFSSLQIEFESFVALKLATVAGLEDEKLVLENRLNHSMITNEVFTQEKGSFDQQNSVLLALIESKEQAISVLQSELEISVKSLNDSTEKYLIDRESFDTLQTSFDNCLLALKVSHDTESIKSRNIIELEEKSVGLKLALGNETAIVQTYKDGLGKEQLRNESLGSELLASLECNELMESNDKLRVVNINMLEETLKLLQVRLENSGKALVVSDETLASKVKFIEELKSKNSKFQSEVEIKSQTVEDLENYVQSLEFQVDDMNVTLAESKDQFLSKDGRYADLVAEFQEFKDAAAKLNDIASSKDTVISQKDSALEAAVIATTESNSLHATDLERLLIHNMALQRANDQTESDLSEKLVALKGLEQTILSLESKLALSDRALVDLKEFSASNASEFNVLSARAEEKYGKLEISVSEKMTALTEGILTLETQAKISVAERVTENEANRLLILKLREELNEKIAIDLKSHNSNVKALDLVIVDLKSKLDNSIECTLEAIDANVKLAEVKDYAIENLKHRIEVQDSKDVDIDSMKRQLELENLTSLILFQKESDLKLVKEEETNLEKLAQLAANISQLKEDKTMSESIRVEDLATIDSLKVELEEEVKYRKVGEDRFMTVQKEWLVIYLTSGKMMFIVHN